MSFENTNPGRPPEQEAAFLANAESAANEAAEPVIKELGALVVGDAEGILADDSPVDEAEALLRDDAQASPLAAEAEAFIKKTQVPDQIEAYPNAHDLLEKDFAEDSGISPTVTEEAEKVLKGHDDWLKNMRSSISIWTRDSGQDFGEALSKALEPTDADNVSSQSKKLIDSSKANQNQEGRYDNEPSVIKEEYQDLATGGKWRKPRVKVEEMPDEES